MHSAPEKTRVVVVDDTAFMRKALVEILSSDPDMEVVGVARHGQELLENMDGLAPDIITLDVDMPVMDGLTTLKNIMVRKPRPVVMISGLADRGNVTFEALRLGAVDFFPKPSGTISLNIHESRHELNKLIKQAAKINPYAIKRAGIPRISPGETDRCRHLEGIISIIAPQGATGHLIRLLANIPLGSGFAIFAFQDFGDDVLMSYSKKMDEILPWDTIPGVRGTETIKPGRCFVMSTKQLADINGENGKFVAGFTSSDNGMKKSLENLSGIFTHKFINIILGGADLDGLEAAKRISEDGGRNIALASDACVYRELSDAAVKAGVAIPVASEPELWQTVKKITDRH